MGNGNGKGKGTSTEDKGKGTSTEDKGTSSTEGGGWESLRLNLRMRTRGLKG